MNDSLSIRWDMSDSVNGLMSQLVFNISLDSGRTFLYLGDIRKSSPHWATKEIKFSLHDSVWDEQLLEWRAITPSNGCVLFISQYNSQTIDDQSDNLFRITAASRSKAFTPPIGKTRKTFTDKSQFDFQGRKIPASKTRLHTSIAVRAHLRIDLRSTR